MINALQKIIRGPSPWDADYSFSNTVYTVYDHFVFSDDVTEYPSIATVHRGERIEHIGGGVRIHTTTYELRGYTRDYEVEQSGESLASDIEHVFDNWRRWSDNIEYKIRSIRTDGGVLAPDGVCIIIVESTRWVT